MLYNLYLKKKRPCPFCGLKKEEIIKQKINAVLILSRAPHTKDHLLVIPKKYVLRFNSLSEKQKKDRKAYRVFKNRGKVIIEEIPKKIEYMPISPLY